MHRCAPCLATRGAPIRRARVTLAGRLRASISRRPRPPRSLRQHLPHSCANCLRQRASSLQVQPVVTMRGTPVFMRGLAQFSKLQSRCKSSDGLKTGAFDRPPATGAGAASTTIGSRWRNAIGLDCHQHHGLQCCEALIASVQSTLPKYFWNLRHVNVRS